MCKKEIVKIFLFIIASFFVLFYLSSAMGQRGGELGKPAELQAELRLYKTEYLLREPIWINIKVTNIGKEDGWFYFNSRMGLVIQDAKGKKYPCNVQASQFPVTIKVGDTLKDEFDLLVDYGISDNKFKLFGYLPPGRYTLFYSVKKGVKTEIDTFTIVQPKDEELKVMNLLKESYDLFIGKKYNEYIEKLNQIIYGYSQSNYAPHALFQKVTMYYIGAVPDLDKTIESYYQMLDTYPNSREAVEVLSYLTHYYKTKPDIPGLISYLNDFIKEYPETEVAKEAQKELAKIEE
jgi:hypothetical protein